MTKVTQISARKSDHIRINLEEDVRSGLSNGLERYRFIHQALPELNLEDIDLSQQILGVPAPILILDDRRHRRSAPSADAGGSSPEMGIAWGLALARRSST
jgi:hypothetical protein